MNIFFTLTGVIVMAICITILATKRPHNPALKTTFVVCITAVGVWSVYGMAHQNEAVAISFGIAFVVLLVWRTVKGWPEWWAQL